MIDIGKEKIEGKCSNCNHKFKVSLKRVAAQATITCLGCKKRINLIDDKRSVKRSIRDINKSFKKLERTFKKFGK